MEGQKPEHQVTNNHQSPCTHHRDGNGPRGAVGVWVRRDQVAHVER